MNTEVSEWIIEDGEHTHCTHEGALSMALAAARMGDRGMRELLLSAPLSPMKKGRLRKALTQKRTPSNGQLVRLLVDLLPVISIDDVEKAW